MLHRRETTGRHGRKASPLSKAGLMLVQQEHEQNQNGLGLLVAQAELDSYFEHGFLHVKQPPGAQRLRCFVIDGVVPGACTPGGRGVCRDVPLCRKRWADPHKAYLRTPCRLCP